MNCDFSVVWNRIKDSPGSFAIAESNDENMAYRLESCHADPSVKNEPVSDASHQISGKTVYPDRFGLSVRPY